MKVKIIIFDGCDEMDALAPFEVLQRATKLGADLQVELVTVDSATEITTAHGVRLRPHAVLSATDKLDVLVVPGGGWNDPNARQSTRTEFERGEIPEVIARLHESGCLVAGVCTGAMLIAGGGILRKRHAITHHAAIDDLRAEGATIVYARVVDDGDIVTSGGVTSGLDLALWLAERFSNPQIAQKIEIQMEYERRGTVWRRVA
jgi:transcriptional regulator GlxA family with amidase domain